jgi:hypothetical protein
LGELQSALRELETDYLLSEGRFGFVLLTCRSKKAPPAHGGGRAAAEIVRHSQRGTAK